MEEDDRTEFKRQLTKESMKTVVAFSNTSGGTLYIGIDDDGTPVGVEDPDSVSLDTVHLLTDTIRPDVTETTDVKRISLDGKNIIRVNVLEGPSKPYYVRDKGLRPEGVYIRKGPSSIQASDSLIAKMLREGSTSYESSISMEQDLTFEDATKVFADCDVEFGESQKNSMGFRKDGSYTVLAYLLSDQCKHGIKLAAYSDRYKTEFLDRAEICGSVLTQTDRALDFLNRYNPLRSTKDGIRRIDYRAYPPSSLREALMNAVVHRDYSQNADTQACVYGDAISVLSYGGLVRGVGIDDIMAGLSSPRNPKLASVFYRLGFIESFGTGIPRIMGDYRESLQKPSFKLTTNVFIVEMPALKPQADDQNAVDLLLELAATKGSFSRADAETALGVSRSKAGAIISSMISEGLLVTSGTGRATRYETADGKR